MPNSNITNKALLDLTEAAYEVLTANKKEVQKVQFNYYIKYKHASIVLNRTPSTAEIEDILYTLPADLALSALTQRHINSQDEIWDFFLEHFYDEANMDTRPPTPEFERCLVDEKESEEPNERYMLRR